MKKVDLGAVPALVEWLWQNPPGTLGCIATRAVVYDQLREANALVARQERAANPRAGEGGKP